MKLLVYLPHLTPFGSINIRIHLPSAPTPLSCEFRSKSLFPDAPSDERISKWQSMIYPLILCFYCQQHTNTQLTDRATCIHVHTIGGGLAYKRITHIWNVRM